MYDKFTIAIVTKVIQGNVTRMLPVALLLVLRIRSNAWQHTRDISLYHFVHGNTHMYLYSICTCTFMVIHSKANSRALLLAVYV